MFLITFFVALSKTDIEPSRLKAIIVFSVAKRAEIDYLAIVIFAYTVRFRLQKRICPFPVPIMSCSLSLIIDKG